MSVSLTINGISYNYPETGDENWGADATDWAIGVTNGMLQKTGGLFQLLAEVDFGTTYGLKSVYYKTRTANVADAGQFRLAKTDNISWRNNAGDGNLPLAINGSDVLTFNGTPIQNSLSVTDTTTIDLTFAADTLSADIVSGSITNAYINASAAIAYSKLNLSGSIVNADISNSAAIAYSKLNLTGDIVNADISSSAAIAYSKLNLALSIVNADVNASAAIAYSKLNLSGSILNADINASAAIAYSKLNLSNGIVNADVNTSAAIAYSKLSLSNSIVNADINTSAAIAFSKLATLTSGNILVGDGSNVATSVAMSGDITISNAGVTAIGANKVTNAMLAQIATARFKGRTTASTGNVEDLTGTQATALLDNFAGDSGSGGTKGLVPAPAAGDAAANKFLGAGGAWSVPTGAGDVTGPGSATDNGFARFNGTTGKVIKNSAATISNADVNSSAAIDVSKLAALTASRAVVSDGSGFISAATTTSTEIGYVNGVTSAIQTQLNGKLPTTITTTGDMIYSSSGTTASRLAIGSSGQVLATLNGVPTWSSFLNGPNQATNFSITCSVSGNAMTISLKDRAGSTASATSPVLIGFRNSTIATGDYSTVSVTGALTTVISSGSTAGLQNGIQGQIYVLAINNAGTAELAWSQTMPNMSGVISTTAEGGSGAADSNYVVYSTTARTNVAATLLGRLTITLATAGTWDAVPTQIELAPLKFNASDAIVAVFTTSAGQSIANNSEDIINYGTRVIDSHNAVSAGAGWTFTCPRAQDYLINASAALTSTAYTSTNVVQVEIFAGGSNRKIGRWVAQASVTMLAQVEAEIIYPCAQGDVIQAKFFQTSGGSVNMQANVVYNVINISSVDRYN